MSAAQEPGGRRPLHPLPRGLVELYGLIAVLVVLIPEWLADGTITIGQQAAPKPFPCKLGASRTLPELRLAAMNLVELRQLAKTLRIIQYASSNRKRLDSATAETTERPECTVIT